MKDAICPHCAIHIEKLTPEVLSENEGATLDCPSCNALLIIKNGRLSDFHKILHEEDERWPEDGKDTSYIGI